MRVTQMGGNRYPRNNRAPVGGSCNGCTCLPQVIFHPITVVTDPADDARQEQLEQDLKRVWEQDPVALMESKGSPEVHGKNSSPN
jgi:hypothetical protein